jgi:hypothetical protein
MRGLDDTASLVSAKIVKVTSQGFIFDTPSQATNYRKTLSYDIDDNGEIQGYYFTPKDAVDAHVDRCRKALEGAQANLVEAFALAEKHTK